MSSQWLMRCSDADFTSGLQRTALKQTCGRLSEVGCHRGRGCVLKVRNVTGRRGQLLARDPNHHCQV